MPNWLKLEVTHPAVEKLSAGIESYCQRMLNGGGLRRLVITGPSGCGKTHVLQRLWAWHGQKPLDVWEKAGLRDANYDSFSCEFLDWPDLVKAGLKSEDGRWSDAEDCGLLLLDDVGSEADQYRSGEHVQMLRLMLQRRANRWTVLTTNIPSRLWASHWDTRVSDRFMRQSQTIDMTGCPSYAVKPVQPKARIERPRATPEQLRKWAQIMREKAAEILGKSRQ